MKRIKKSLFGIGLGLAMIMGIGFGLMPDRAYSEEPGGKITCWSAGNTSTNYNDFFCKCSTCTDIHYSIPSGGKGKCKPNAN